MSESSPFQQIWDVVRADPNNLVVKPPKDGRSGKIPTGLLKWIKPGDETERDFFITGPPCSAFPLVNPATNTVRYAKCSLRMVRENELDAEAIAQLRPHAQERAQFTNFVRDMENRVLERVQQSHALFGFKESMDPQRIHLNQVIKTPSNPEWSCLMTCKLDVTDAASPTKENIEPEHIRLRIRDVDGKELRVADMRDQDKYLPLFSSVYPYFNTRGEIGLQWKLVGLQVIERGPPRRSELEMSNGPWVANLGRYIASPTGSAVNLDPTEAEPVLAAALAEEGAGAGAGAGVVPEGGASAPDDLVKDPVVLKTENAPDAVAAPAADPAGDAGLMEPKVKRMKTAVGVKAE